MHNVYAFVAMLAGYFGDTNDETSIYALQCMVGKQEAVICTNFRDAGQRTGIANFILRLPLI